MVLRKCAPQSPKLRNPQVKAADNVVDHAAAARTQRLAQGRLVLVEAMAHGHAHLLAGLLHFAGDAHRGFERIGDRLLRDDVHVVGQRDIHDRLVEGRGDHN